MSMRTEYRAVFTYPTPWDKDSPTSAGYGPARSTREEAEADRPLRPEETHGCQAGIQSREVTEWKDEA